MSDENGPVEATAPSEVAATFRGWTSERMSVSDLVGICKYIYVRPDLLNAARAKFGNDAIVNADWRLVGEGKEWYVASCPVPVPKPCADVACFNPLGDGHPGMHHYRVEASE